MINGCNQASVPGEEKGDVQLMEIYRREAAEILASGHAMLRLWSVDWTNDGLLNALRRQIQSLQNRSQAAGYGNMVEVTSAVISVVDAVISGKAKGVLMTETLHRALEVMTYLLTQIQKGSDKNTSHKNFH